jgi:hypothetical protein
MKELFTAFIAAQREIKTALKDSKNPHFKSTYADLESVWDACRDALHKHGLGIMQLTDLDPSGVPVLVTRIVHESGQHVEGRYPLLCKDPNNPQACLAALTYARRGSLAAACGVVQSDDDGNTAAGHTASHTAPPSPAKPVSAPTTAKATGNAMTDLFAAHKLEYPKAVEDLIGKPVKEWSENDKTTAREAIKKLQAGVPWSQVVKDKVFS